MQRRCQEVINACCNRGEENPIRSIHDVGAGGLSNAIPELVYSDGLGCLIDLRSIHSAEKQMTPKALWCNESQERYVLAIKKEKLDLLQQIASRERCPYAVVGTVSQQPTLSVYDAYFKLNSTF